MSSSHDVSGEALRESEALAPNLIPHPVATIEAAEGPTTMSKWLWLAYPIGLIGIGAVWGGLISVLLGRQVAEITTDPQAAAGVLGLVMSAGSLIALVAQPVMGRLSDLTRVRFLGRRNIWVLFGALGGAAVLVSMAFSQNLVLVGVLYAVAMLPLSGLQAALTAVLPERVPIARRGTMSGLVGTSSVAGTVLGVALAGLAGTVTVGYILIASFLVVTSALFALTTKDVPAPARTERTAQEKKQARKLPGLRSHPDFWLTFFGRFMLIFGYFLIAGFNLYLLKDYIKVGDGSIEAASQMVVAVSGISALFLLVFSVIGGILSDRFGRVRIFVALSTLLFIPAGIVFLVVPTLTGFFIAQAILGLAFGVFTAVDQVLITRVLPGTENAARDLGLINIANSGPQVIAPAVAGAIIAATGNYAILFILMMVSVTIASISVRFIKSVP